MAQNVSMRKDYSPFSPGVPVPPEFFVGRRQEVEELLARGRAAKRGRVETAFLVGGRGIGKSSLASFVRRLMQTQERMLAVHVFLGGVSELDEMTKRVFDRLLNDAITQPWHERLRDLLKDHVKQVGLFGIGLEFAAGKRELQSITTGFGRALGGVLERARPDVEGMLLILDDINGLANTPAFADWLKTTVDDIATRDVVLPLCLVLVGLPERRTALVEAQPSLARLLTPVVLEPWADDETDEFFASTLRKVDVTVDADALPTLRGYSGGLPVLAHEIGDAAFTADTDNRIDRGDAFVGVARAAVVVGRQYLEPRVYEAIRSQRYRAILRKLAEMREPIRRVQLSASVDDEQRKVVDNFLTKMKRLDVLTADREAGPGAYRFTNALYRLYMRMEAAGATHRRADAE